MPLFILRLLFLLPVGLSQQASTLSGEGTVYAALGGDVVIPWNLIPGPGSTTTSIAWRKDPATAIAQMFGTTFVPDAAYAARVSQVPGSTASIRLTGILEGDFAIYRCTAIVNDGGTPVQLVDTQELQKQEPAENVTISSNAAGSEVMKGDSVSLMCNSSGGNPSPSYFWLRNDTIVKFTTSNTWIISSFQKEDEGDYTCIASNIAGNVTSSNRIPLLFVSGDDHMCRGTVVVFVFVALLSAILMALILFADRWQSFCMVKYIACIGPVVGFLLAGVEIVLATLQLTSGNDTCTPSHEGYIHIIWVSGAAALMSICASIAGCLFKKSGNEVDFPVVTVSFEFALGLMVATAGIVVSVVYVQQQDARVAGLVVATISLVLLVIAFIWFIARVCCGNRQSSRDLPGPEGRQEDNEDL